MILIIEVYMLLIIIQRSKWKHCLFISCKISIPLLIELSFQIKIDFLVDKCSIEKTFQLVVFFILDLNRSTDLPEDYVYSKVHIK